MSFQSRHEAEAYLLNDQTLWYGYWRSYVDERRAALDARLVQTGPDALTVPLRAMSATATPLADLPFAVRQQLAQLVEEERRAAQVRAEDEARRMGTPLPTVDMVEQAVLDELDAELRGKRHDLGWPVFWYGGRKQGIDVATVVGSTTDADYAVLAPKRWSIERVRQSLRRQWGAWSLGRRVVVLGALGAVVLLMCGAVLRVALADTTIPKLSAPPPPPVVAETPVPLWTVQRLGVGGHEEAISVSSLGVPVRVCVAPSQHKALTPGVTVVLTGTGGIRQYTLDATAKRPDLVLADCRGAAPSDLGKATLVTTTTDFVLPAEAVTQITTWAANTDPEHIPGDRTAVEVDVVREVGRAAQLVLGDGTHIPTAATSEIEGGFRLRFLVPATLGPQQVGLVMIGAFGLPAHLALDLPAPQTRERQLRAGLKITGSAAAQRGSTVVLTLTVVLDQGAAPVTLRQGDLLITANERPLMGVRWTPPMLTPGKPVTIPISIPLGEVRGPIETRLGGWQARLRWQTKSGS